MSEGGALKSILVRYCIPVEIILQINYFVDTTNTSYRIFIVHGYC